MQITSVRYRELDLRGSADQIKKPSRGFVLMSLAGQRRRFERAPLTSGVPR
jgi:hypothetical protein